MKIVAGLKAVPAEKCWCGSRSLGSFSDSYLVCRRCETLVASLMPSSDPSVLDTDETAFYGRGYWYRHQRKSYDQPDIEERARHDLTERCLHWLRVLLKYVQPPGRVLEIGAAHGGFVHLMARTGFDAQGLELSPAIAEYARETFGVPMLVGPIEDQELEDESLCAISLMDVLEHLVDPLRTVQVCHRLLARGGMLVLQTPCFPAELDYAALTDQNHPFLSQLKEAEHLFLFSKNAVGILLDQAGFEWHRFEQAIFSQYDMFVVAGVSGRPPEAAEEHLAGKGKEENPVEDPLVCALLDLRAREEMLLARLSESERDRAERLQLIQRLANDMEVTEADRAARLEVIGRLEAQLAESEADRAARLEVIGRLEVQLQESEADRAARLELIEKLGERLRESEADRAARLAVIEALRSTEAQNRT